MTATQTPRYVPSADAAGVVHARRAFLTSAACSWDVRSLDDVDAPVDCPACLARLAAVGVDAAAVTPRIPAPAPAWACGDADQRPAGTWSPLGPGEDPDNR